MSSKPSSPSFDDIASTVLTAIAPLGHPVAERYVRSLRFIGTPGLRAERNASNGTLGESVYDAIESMSPRDRDLACLRDATSPHPQLSVEWLGAEPQSIGPLRAWALLIAAARAGQLAALAARLAPFEGSNAPVASILPAAAQLARVEASRSAADSSSQASPTASTLPPVSTATPTPRNAGPLSVGAATLDPARPPLAAQVATLEATARKTGDPVARAALYYRIGRLHEEQLGAPRSALESYLLAFMLDPLPFAHFEAVERACSEAERHKDLVHIYQSGVEAIDAGARYPVTSAELLWRCLQTQETRLLRTAEAEATAARLALEPSADAALLTRLAAWLKGRDPRNEPLLALVTSRLPAP